MTPDEFREAVLPDVVAAWRRSCMCTSPGFRKLLAFDFRDYDGIGPVGLADTEILIDVIVRNEFTAQGEPVSGAGETTQDYVCSQCGVRCTVHHEDYSINMACSVVDFADAEISASTGLYLVGFYGFKREDFGKVDDYRKAVSRDEFLRALSGA